MSEVLPDELARVRRENVALRMLLEDAADSRSRLFWAGVRLAVVSLVVGAAFGWVIR